MDSTITDTPISSTPVLSTTFYAFLAKVYGWMTLALTITFVVAFATTYIIERNFALARFLYSIDIILLLGLFLMVVAFSAIVHRVSLAISAVLFIIYSMFMGVFLGTYIFLFTVPSVVVCILATVILFAVVSLFGYVTKTDMTSWGGLIFTALIGLFIGTIINFFMYIVSPAFAQGMYWILTYVGIAVFIVTLAYDTQMLKNLAHEGENTGMNMNKVALSGALNLYLDFINLFIRILAILGKRK